MEINLMDTAEYTQIERDVAKRLDEKKKHPEMITTSKKFDWEYFDKKGYCYNGYIYDGRWIPIAKRLVDHYKLKPDAKILDIGCAKGYLVYDLRNQGMDAYGIDISKYAIDCCPPPVRNYVSERDVRDLECYNKKEFDLVLCINTLENIPEPDVRKALRDIQWIGKNAFIRLDAWHNAEEEQRMMDWHLTGITMMHVDAWKRMFQEEGYTGDYYWFTP